MLSHHLRFVSNVILCTRLNAIKQYINYKMAHHNIIICTVEHFYNPIVLCRTNFLEYHIQDSGKQHFKLDVAHRK